MKCFGQPCQKQPSTNTAIFALEKTMSARDRTPFSGEQSTRKRSPRECRIERKASSGLVSRLLFAAIVRRACSEEAQDDSMSVPSNGRAVYHLRSEERRVGKECRAPWSRERYKSSKNINVEHGCNC